MFRPYLQMLGGMHPIPTTSHPTTRQVAAALQVTPRTVADYLRRGWLSGQRLGKAWRIDQESVDRLLRLGPPR